MSQDNTNLENLFFEYKTEDISKKSELIERYKKIKTAFSKENKFINNTNKHFTDHSIGHIVEVQNRLYEILQQSKEELTVVELYITLSTTFFHDWGNVIDREGHRDATSVFYNEIFTSQEIYPQELLAFNNVVRAHTGSSIAGDKDTLKDVKDTFVHQKESRLQLIAAILRFADELAECPERVNISYIKTTPLPQDSLLHHLHALFIRNIVESAKGRIAVTYSIGIINKGNNEYTVSYPGTDKEISLAIFLQFLSERIQKTNMERRYTQYYMRKLALFHEMSVSITFIFMKDKQFSGKSYTYPAFTLTDKVLLDNPTKLPFDSASIIDELNRC